MATVYKMVKSRNAKQDLVAALSKFGKSPVADTGTHEGAVKAAQTRRMHQGSSPLENDWNPVSVARHNEWQKQHDALKKQQAQNKPSGFSGQVTEKTHTPDQLKAAIARAPMIGGHGSQEGGLRRSSLVEHSLGKVLKRNGGKLPVGTRFVDDDGNVGAYMGSYVMPNGGVGHTIKMANGKVHSGYGISIPNLYLAREVGKFL